MFNYKIKLLGFEMSLLSIILFLFIFLVGFFLSAIFVYTIKHKNKLINTSYIHSGIRMNKEFQKLDKNNISIRLSEYKMFSNLNKNIVHLSKTSLDNSLWDQAYGLFFSSFIKKRNKINIIMLILSFIQVASMIFLFISNSIINYIGLALFIFTFLTAIICNYVSVKNVNHILLILKNKSDKKTINNLKSVLKYYKFYYIYKWFILMGLLLKDSIHFIKNNGIKGK